MEPGIETTCGSLLRELQHIWDEVGESDEERDRMLLQLEEECLEVYRRKVDQANHGRARLHRALADAEAELAALVSVLGERPVIIENRLGTLKDQFAAVYPHVEEMRQKKEERTRQIANVKLQIQRIRSEIAGVLLDDASADDDLTLRKLEEYQFQLQTLQEEKSDRMNKVMEYVNLIHDLCSVLSLDFCNTVADVHPSLQKSDNAHSRSISNETLEKLHNTVQRLQEEKKVRVMKLQDLGESLIELWDLMDTSSEEQNFFQHVTCHLAATDDEIITPGALSFDVMEQAEAEVQRLSQLKVSKMKELVLKKRLELEEICRRAHMECDGNVAEEKIVALIDSGMIDPSDLLSSMEDQIGKAKEEAFCRKEIMEKIERWITACEEESWLEDYNKDENRYSASRGAHLNLKRAERARTTVNKLPALVESLRAKAKSWEEERGSPFFYDGVSLLAMLEEYNVLRQEKEEEKRRMRDHKRIQEQLMTEQEVLFGSRPSPSKSGSVKKNATATRGNGTPASRRLSLGGAGTPDLLTPRVNGVTPSRLAVASAKENKKERGRPTHIVTTLPKEDSAGGVTPQQQTTTSVLDRKPLTPVALASSKTNVELLSPVRPPPSAVKHNKMISVLATNNSNHKPDLQEVIVTGKQATSSFINNTAAINSSSNRLEEQYRGFLVNPEVPVVVPSRVKECEYSFEERRLLCLGVVS